MRTDQQRGDPRADGHPATEQLWWDVPVVAHAESRAPDDREPARGHQLRLHADPECADRLAPGAPLVARRYDAARADRLCPACGPALLAGSGSSVVARLRDAERTLLRLQQRASDGPMPREVVHCRALRYEAETAASVHPDAPELAARVVELAGEVGMQLRAAMVAYDRRR